MQDETMKMLINNVEIPQVGFGVYQVPPEETYDTVLSALEAGYRHIDTASFYDNEEGVGKAVADSGIDRKDIFITTKVWNDEQGYDQTLEAFDRSLKRLDTDYVDLYLIHWPIKERFKDTWRALEHLYKTGFVKAIGVSNFLDHHLQSLFETADIRPMINQIELHPKVIEQSTVAFCQENNILIEAWSPLGRASYLDEPVIVQLAKKYERTPAQIILRWHVQQGFIIIPRSTNKQRQLENRTVFDFHLAKEDINDISALNDGSRIGSHPDDIKRK